MQDSYSSPAVSHLRTRLILVKTFYRMMFYPVSAILTLSRNIILKPWSRVAHSDLNILIDVSETIRLLENGENGVSEGQLESLEAVSELVQQLVDQASSLVLECQRDTT